MVGKYLERCPVCGGKITRKQVPYVVGRVVVEPKLEADVCVECGEEFYAAKQVARAQVKAAKLGLLQTKLAEERELQRLGGSLVVTIPKPMVRALGLRPKQRVKLKLTTDGINIEVRHATR